MKKYEIINPSDKCFISGDNAEMVAAAGLFLGNGKYSIVGDDGKRIGIFAPFGLTDDGLNKAWSEEFGRTFEDLLSAEPWDALADVLDTFQYASERSSMNNIGSRAKSLAKSFRDRPAKV